MTNKYKLEGVEQVVLVVSTLFLSVSQAGTIISAMFLWFPDLPLELQCAIILRLKDEHDVRHYALMARRFYTWLVVVFCK